MEQLSFTLGARPTKQADFKPLTISGNPKKSQKLIQKSTKAA